MQQMLRTIAIPTNEAVLLKHEISRCFIQIGTPTHTNSPVKQNNKRDMVRHSRKNILEMEQIQNTN